jgi:hypothetical protein
LETQIEKFVADGEDRERKLMGKIKEMRFKCKRNYNSRNQFQRRNERLPFVLAFCGKRIDRKKGAMALK